MQFSFLKICFCIKFFNEDISLLSLIVNDLVFYSELSSLLCLVAVNAIMFLEFVLVELLSRV